MKRCVRCGLLNPPSALWCDCGKEFPRLETSPEQQDGAQTTKPTYADDSLSGMEEWEGNAVNDFFAFRTMWTPTLLKMIYVCGLLAILGYGAYGAYNAKGTAVGLWIAATIAAQILWRLLCEAWILFFSMHERLHEIRKEIIEIQSIVWRQRQ